MLRAIQSASLLFVFLAGCASSAGDNLTPSYDELRIAFANPDHARYGEVPLWWWEGDRMTKERVTWQLETLAAEGVKSVCPIQRSPGRCDPQSFSPEWWDMFEYVHAECKRLGMTLWAYDQLGYGHYGWLEKAAAQVRDDRTRRVDFKTADATAGKPARIELPEGTLVTARAYPVTDKQATDADSVDLRSSVKDNVLTWTPPTGNYRVAVGVAVPFLSFHLSDKAADAFIDMFYGRIERRLGKDAMGTSFVGIFQDEHPPIPRDIYTEQLADAFEDRCGYDIGRAIPALHFDVGPLTPKYRTDFFDTYIAVDEKCYWRRVYDWISDRNLLTSYDNWGRKNIYRQSEGYMDYFRNQRWFSAPGYDDYGQHPVTQRNYYDTKIAASIARLYDRPRVWSESFHSSGWGRTTDQTLSWLSANYAFGANLYDEHGFYYSTRASTWEHAAPDPHFRQPYWRYYDQLSDWLARMSHLMTRGTHVVDVAVHYPVASLLAGERPGAKGPDYNLYMKLSRTLYDAGIDNDIADDDSILGGTVRNGKLEIAGNEYRALVFGPENTLRRSVLERAVKLAETGGTVVFFQTLPTITTDAGRDDPELEALLGRLLGDRLLTEPTKETVARTFDSGGCAVFVPENNADIVKFVSRHVKRDFVPTGGTVYVNHRTIGDLDVYLVQNVEEKAIDLTARCRVDGVPELWDPFTGVVSPVDQFERKDGATTVRHRLEGNTAHLFVFKPGTETAGGSGLAKAAAGTKKLSDDWTFSVIPTRDNKWGEFRWPPSGDVIGPEIRAFRYAEENGKPGTEQGWNKPAFDDKEWSAALYSIGPRWLCLAPVPGKDDLAKTINADPGTVKAGAKHTVGTEALTWEPVEFSKTIGRARPAPWGGHSGYPDGAIDENFVDLPKGRKLLFTHIRSPKEQRLGLRVELRNDKPRLWVNGVEQPFEDAIGNLPLKKGPNAVLLDLPNGEKGRLYVQKMAPSVRTMDEAARGMVAPDLSAASWIWAGNTTACYLRKTFTLPSVPKQCRIVVTADNGYRLFVNGVKVEEEIGPWARWEYPESFNITPHLRKGKNVVAVWGQDLGAERGVALAVKARFADGSEQAFVTDAAWKGTVAEHDGWTTADFEESAWSPVTVIGKMGCEPWKTEPLQNIGSASVPRRKLAIDLPAPYLTCFDEVPDIVHDVKAAEAGRIGWFRFKAPPGLSTLDLRTKAKAQVWVDGQPADVADGVARIKSAPAGASTVAVRLEMLPGQYGGAAFPLPLGLTLEGGKIQTGPWTNFALPTYSGIGVYSQTVAFTPDELKSRVILDLGKVLVAAEVLVNDKPVGVRLAAPFKFDLTESLKPGPNRIDVRVANTIAPHYTVTNKVHNLGPTTSGLMGPVTLTLQPRNQ